MERAHFLKVYSCKITVWSCWKCFLTNCLVELCKNSYRIVARCWHTECADKTRQMTMIKQRSSKLCFEQVSLSKGIDKKKVTGEIFLISVTHFCEEFVFMREQNGLNFYIIFSNNYFLNVNHICMARIVCRKWFLFQVEIK